MSVYVITGKLGSGKSLVAVGRIRDYLRAGRRVATNLDLRLENLLPADDRSTVQRVPDKPRVEDLVALGSGDGRPMEEYEESGFGLLVLDELATWFNSRNWNDKERLRVIEWMVQARKLHWDILLIVQSIDVIDRQLRETLCEHLVVCRRLDRLKVPFLPIKLPRVHVASVYYGDSPSALRVDRWWYRGADLFGGYYTGQVFKSDQLPQLDGSVVDMRASSTVLSAWHVHGRYLQRRAWWSELWRLVAGSYVVAAAMVCGGLRGRSPRAQLTRWGFL